MKSKSFLSLCGGLAIAATSWWHVQGATPVAETMKASTNDIVIEGTHLRVTKDATRITLTNGKTVQLPEGVTAFDPNGKVMVDGKVEGLVSDKDLEAINRTMQEYLQAMSEKDLQAQGLDGHTIKAVRLNGLQYYQLKAQDQVGHHVAYAVDIDITWPGKSVQEQGVKGKESLSLDSQQLDSLNQSVNGEWQKQVDLLLASLRQGHVQGKLDIPVSSPEYKQALALTEQVLRLFSLETNRMQMMHQVGDRTSREDMAVSMALRYDGFVVPYASYILTTNRDGHRHAFAVFMNDADHTFWDTRLKNLEMQ